MISLPAHAPLRVLLLASPFWLVLPGKALADADCLHDGRRIALAFASGAAWSLCARVDSSHGLSFDDISYRAPGDRERPVLRSLHPGAVLVRDHDRAGVRSLFTLPRQVADDLPCDGVRESLASSATALPDDASDDEADNEPVVCLSRHATGLLTRFGDIRGRQGAEWRIELGERIGGEAWRTRVAFGESGRLTPRLSLDLDAARGVSDSRFGVERSSGSIELERSVLVTWRIAPALDAPATNRIEEFDFTLEPSLGSRRVMAVRALPVEALRPVAPDRFRGWRIVTTDGAGYYLDSQSQVSGWPGGGGNWTRFALAVTTADDCEQEAAAAATPPRCGAVQPASLDRWVDGETLDGSAPVLWFSQALLASPGVDGGTVGLQFDLLPFDWTARSPFAAGFDGE